MLSLPSRPVFTHAGAGNRRFARWAAPLILGLLSACATTGASREAVAPVPVRIIAFNDFHGNLDPANQVVVGNRADGSVVPVPTGGAAWFAATIDSLRADAPNHAIVSAGDMIGGTPLVSALFLDEPTIHAMNAIKIDFNAAGNHEFDKGRAELLRMQNGGCAKHTRLEPCVVDKQFPGASFQFLAGNTLTESGAPLFPATGLKTFGKGRNAVKVGFIGLTLKDTPTLVTPSGIAGLTFADEADTANRGVRALKAQGADAIVLLIHQGIFTTVGYNDKSCAGPSGDLLTVLPRLDPAIDVIVSGHTHAAYICDYSKIDPARPFLLTSAFKFGSLVTKIDLTIDPVAKRVVSKAADNVMVQSVPYQSPRGPVPLTDAFPVLTPRADIAALVTRYREAAEGKRAEPVGRLSGPAAKEKNADGESTLGNLIADAQLAATRAPDKGGAQIAFMNPDGLRTDVTPDADGRVTFGALFAAQPFGNALMIKTMTGAQIKTVLEQQFADPEWLRVLSVSDGFRFAYDLSRPAGSRVLEATLNGMPLNDAAPYRVTMNSFLASGGDKFTTFVSGTDPIVGPGDIESLSAWIAALPIRPIPALGRVSNRTPK